MSKARTDIIHGAPVPQDWFDSLMEYVSTMSGNFVLSLANPTTVQVVAGTGANQVTVGVGGPFRYRTTTITAAHPGGASGSYDVYVVASANVFVPGVPEVDNTDYTFGLQIVTGGAAAPTGTYGARAIAHTRLMGSLTWNGSAITALYPKGGSPSPTYPNDDVIARQGIATQVLIGAVGGAAGVALGLAGDVTVVRSASGPKAVVNSPLDATAFQVAGTALAAAHLSNGVTGSGAVALAVTPTFTGAPAAPTAAADTSTTQLATTAFVIGQAASAVPNMDGAGTVGTSLRYARQDHIHPTDTSRAPLASPGLTGVPTAPTAALDTNSTQVATTAFVLAQAASVAPLMNSVAAVGTSPRYARQDHVHPSDTTHAPLASPALTGTPTGPTAAVDTNTTQLATTAFVLSQVATVAPLMDGAAAVGSSFRYARQDHVHPTDTSRAPLASPALSGTPTAPTAAVDTNTTQVATTAFVLGQAGSANPTMDGAVSIGTSLRYARQDHVHPSDTSRLAIPGGIAAGETVVFNGASFVRSTSTLIGVASLGSGTPSIATYLRGDGTWAPLNLQINTQPASYQLVLADAQKVVEVSSGGTLVVPPNSTVAFPIGTNITIVQTGAAQVTLAAGAGVTLRANPGAKLASQWAMASLYKRATDEWVAGGNLIP